MPRSVTEWNSDVLGQSKHVDQNIISGRDFTSATSIVLGSRKGQVDADSGSFTKDGNNSPTQADFQAIGVVQNASVAQNKQLAQIFEIGSRESYFIPGRTVVQASLSRVMIDGDSLMKVMYPIHDYADDQTKYLEDAGFKNIGADAGTENWFFVNLSSNFFNNSLDLSFWFYDGENQSLGAFYLKNAHIQAHQISLASQQTVVLENISLRASQVIGISAI